MDKEQYSIRINLHETTITTYYTLRWLDSLFKELTNLSNFAFCNSTFKTLHHNVNPNQMNILRYLHIINIGIH